MMTRYRRGFTLIELVIAVTIVGILAAIAYPGYVNQVRKSRRSEARSALRHAANQQERFHKKQFTYANTVDAEGFDIPTETQNKYYRIQVDSADKKSFQMSAIAENDQANDACKQLTINNLGETTSKGVDCW